MTGYACIDWYETPAYYDLVFDPDTKREADFVEAALEKYGNLSPGRTNGLRVLEPACGSGRMIAEMSRRGYRVHGFDSSAAMLRFARKRLLQAGLRAQLRNGLLEDFAYPRRFHLAHCLVSTFKYLHDEPGALSHLRCIADCLEPGGIYLLGLHLTDYTNEKKARERWVVKKRGLQVVCNTQTWPANRRARCERVRTRLVVDERGVQHRSETNWNFRTYSACQLRRLLARIPKLELAAVHDFHYDIEWTGELTDAASDVLLVLRKGVLS